MRAIVLEAVGPDAITTTAAASYETPSRRDIREGPAYPQALGAGHVRCGDENLAGPRYAETAAQHRTSEPSARGSNWCHT